MNKYKVIYVRQKKSLKVDMAISGFKSDFTLFFKLFYVSKTFYNKYVLLI